jgi:hypothetical protein
VVSLAVVVIILTILGLVLLPTGIMAVIFNVRAFGRRPRLLSVPVAALSLGVGIAVATLSFSSAYSPDPTHRVLGVPFPEVVLERHGESWEDFAGPLTLPAMLANALVALLAPQLVVAASRGKKWRV